ncbi:MAG: hypothetical protein HW390_2901 [Candidatus Brocadiaceae bacterium]|nr:hypothetical protein [Candidatus Brocadiaceae bacterium]
MERYPSFILVVFIVLTSFCVSTHADIITLKNANHDVELKVLGVFDEHISAAIPGKTIKTLVKQFSDVKSYPDVLFMISPGVTIVCKIKEVTEDTVRILIPASGISSLKTGTQPSVKAETITPVDRISDKPRDVVGDVKTPPQEKTGVERNSRWQPEPLSQFGRISDKPKEVVEEVKTPLQERTGVERNSRLQPEPLNQDGKLGSVEGKIFQNGKPLQNCQVKLVMMEKYGYLTNEYRIMEGALEMESVTDEHGIYYFANVPPGKYKMYWMPPSETGWIRRLKMDPDVVVKSGKLVTPKDVETVKRTLN